MIAANYGSIADIEIVWTLVAVAGAGFSLFNVNDAIKDVRYARDTPGNGSRIVAWASLRVESARLVIQLIYALIGVFAMLLPEIPDQLDQPWDQVAIGAAIRWGLLLSGALIFYQSVENRRMRVLLLHPQRRKEDSHDDR